MKIMDKKQSSQSNQHIDKSLFEQKFYDLLLEMKYKSNDILIILKSKPFNYLTDLLNYNKFLENIDSSSPKDISTSSPKKKKDIAKVNESKSEKTEDDSSILNCNSFKLDVKDIDDEFYESSNESDSSNESESSNESDASDKIKILLDMGYNKDVIDICYEINPDFDLVQAIDYLSEQDKINLQLSQKTTSNKLNGYTLASRAVQKEIMLEQEKTIDF